MKYSKDYSEMVNHFHQQRSFIQRSIRSYDSGYEDEAQRIATIIRILLHDTKTSTSLLKHLRLKERINYLSTVGEYKPTNMLSFEGLLASSSTGQYLPHCLCSDKIEGMLLQFDDWWNQIVLDDKINSFSRKKLVLEVANTDGGAHIDKELNEAYANLTKNYSLSGKLLINGETHPFKNSPVYACIRQIAFELLYSIDFHENIKSYIRKHDTNINYIANYIGENIYIIHAENLGHPLFLDSRVTKSEDRNHYVDEILFINGSKGKTHILML